MIRNLSKKLSKRFQKKSYGRKELDLKLLPFLDYRGGTFVEAGANDGIRQSNTLYFEKYKGWKGLLIEAIPALAEQCRQNRPRCIVENCALVSPDYPGKTVEMEYYDLMSFVKGGFGNVADEILHTEGAIKILSGERENHYSVSSPARTLSDVLTAHGISRIDLLSLDVEGYEANVLKGIDFTKHTPQFMLIETRHYQKSAIDTLLAPHYDQLAVLSTNDSYSEILFHSRNY